MRIVLAVAVVECGGRGIVVVVAWRVTFLETVASRCASCAHSTREAYGWSDSDRWVTVGFGLVRERFN